MNQIFKRTNNKPYQPARWTKCGLRQNNWTCYHLSLGTWPKNKGPSLCLLLIRHKFLRMRRSSFPKRGQKWSTIAVLGRDIKHQGEAKQRQPSDYEILKWLADFELVFNCKVMATIQESLYLKFTNDHSYVQCPCIWKHEDADFIKTW